MLLKSTFMKCQIETVDPSGEWLESFLQCACRRTFFKKSYVVHPGDETERLGYLIRGSLKVMRESDNGKFVILNYLLPGQFFNVTRFLDPNARSPAAIIANEKCECADMSYPMAHQFACNNQEFMCAIARQLSQRKNMLSEKVQDLVFLDATGRVHKALLDLAKRPSAITHPDGMQIKITRQEIAEFVGCSREMVGRILHNFQERGLMEAKGSTMVIYGTR